MFNKKGKINWLFTIIFMLIVPVVAGGLLFVLYIGSKIGFQNIIPCQLHSECELVFVDENNIKDDKICADMKESGYHLKSICYLMVAENSGDERFCDKTTDFSAKGAELCRLGTKLIGKELVLNEKWNSQGHDDNFFYADQATFMGRFGRDMDKSGKIMVLELPVKIVLLELDNKNYLSASANWNPKYNTRFNGAKVKIIDGKYAGREGWLDFEAIIKNQPLSPVNEEKGENCGNYICSSGETAINCPEDCDPAVCLSAGMTFIPNGIKKCCPGTEARKSTNACIPTNNGCSYGEGFLCEWSYETDSQSEQ